MNVLDQVEKEQFRANKVSYCIGDTVDVHVKIKEGEKERIQIFNGVVIKKKGCGLRETFTVRRIVQGEGVERIFPLHSPKVADVVVKRKGKVRRAKLYFLRGRVGKATKVEEQIGKGPSAASTEAAAPPTPAASAPASAPPASAAPAAEKAAAPQPAKKAETSAEKK